jgi:hypothetical protein
MSELFLQHLFQRFSSDVLWHFVGRKDKNNPDKCFQIILSILKEGKLRIGSEPEPFIYHRQNTSTDKLIGYPVCCLADIPLKDLTLHSIRYGRYAIGFHRKSAIKNNFIPVLYVPQKSWIIDYAIQIRGELESFLENESQEMSEKFQEFLLFLGSVSKPCDFNVNLEDDPAKDQMQISNFYYEREWRSIYEWNFRPEDVAMIIVEKPEDIETLHNQIHNGILKVRDTVPTLSFDMIFKI